MIFYANICRSKVIKVDNIKILKGNQPTKGPQFQRTLCFTEKSKLKYLRSSAVFKTPENGMVEKNNLHKCCLISTFEIVLDLAIISREWIGRGIQFHLKHFHDFLTLSWNVFLGETLSANGKDALFMPSFSPRQNEKITLLP